MQNGSLTRFSGERLCLLSRRSQVESVVSVRMESNKRVDYRDSTLCPDVKPFFPRQILQGQPHLPLDAFPTAGRNGLARGYPDSCWTVPRSTFADSGWKDSGRLKAKQRFGGSGISDRNIARILPPNHSKEVSECASLDLGVSESSESLTFNVLRSAEKSRPKNREKRNARDIHSETVNADRSITSESPPAFEVHCPSKKLNTLQKRQSTFAEVIRDRRIDRTEFTRRTVKDDGDLVDKKICSRHLMCVPLTTQFNNGTMVSSSNSKDAEVSTKCTTVASDDGDVKKEHGHSAESEWCTTKRNRRTNRDLSFNDAAVVHRNQCLKRTDEHSPEKGGASSCKMETDCKEERERVRRLQNVSRLSNNSSLKTKAIICEKGDKIKERKENLYDAISLASDCRAKNVCHDKENGAMQKKKKKTDSQRKKEYKNKLKSLPSVQGKILTVTHEFYSLVQEKNLPPRTVMPNETEKGLDSLHWDDFPALGENASKACFDASAVDGEQVLDSGAHSDSDWSDIDDDQCQSENAVSRHSDFPTLGVLARQTEKRGVTYSELLMKSTRGGAFLKSETSGKRSALLVSACKSTSDDRNPISAQSGDAVNPKPSSHFGTSALVAPSRISQKPKANSLIQLDLMNMLTKKQKNDKDKTRLITKDGRKVTKVRPVIANILDSSAPTRRRGKEREKPSKKKPTALKKIIIQERQEKKMKSEERVLPTGSRDDLVSEVGPAKAGRDERLADPENDNVPPTISVTTAAKAIIHNRRFREYCNQLLNPEIDEVVTKLIQDLIRFHDRLYQKDPIKAKMRRRIVVGLREVTKHLKLKKLKCLVLAPNLEKIKSDGGLDAAVNTIITLAEEQSVPFVFALGRKALGRICLKKVPVSCVGIFNYDGSEANFKRLCELAALAQEAYGKALDCAILKVADTLDSHSGL